jgi:hypothetical protein
MPKRTFFPIGIRLVLAAAALLLVACERELGRDLPFEGPRLVIYGLCSPHTLSVQLTQTLPPTGDHLYGDGVQNATVSLFEEGVWIENLVHVREGKYRSATGFIPKAGKSYSLRVVAEGFPDAETPAETVPSPVTITQYEFSQPITSALNEDFPARRLSFTLMDEGNELNYYAADITGYQKDSIMTIETFSMDRPDDIEDICGLRGEFSTYLLSDACFNGNSFEVTTGVETRGFLRDLPSKNKAWNFIRDCDRVVLSVRKINRGYYDYLRSSYQEEGFLQVFAGQRNQFSNIKGGYGLWAVYQESQINIL